MDNIAKLDQQQRAELFEQTASRRGFHPAIAGRLSSNEADVLLGATELGCRGYRALDTGK